jgi:hypothetical protein
LCAACLQIIQFQPATIYLWLDNGRLGNHLWIWTVLVITWLAVGKHEQQQPEAAYERDCSNEKPPTTFPDIMESSYNKCQ